MYVVYVLDKKGKPLMPTKRFGKVRRLLKEKKAVVISKKPFVIRLKYEPETHITQPLHGGIDLGRTNIGIAVVNDKGQTVYTLNARSRNKKIPKLMAARKTHRQASRRGERLRRKRRAKKYKTTKIFKEGRKLPGYKNGVLALKDIINTEARFNNRKRPENWITPTVKQCIQTHLSLIKLIHQILPVTDWSIEHNRFAFMVMEDKTIRGKDFQNGRLKTYKDAYDYIMHLQNNKCAACDNKIEHIHHLIPRSEGGSSRPENLIGLCHSCHIEVHKGRLTLRLIGEKKKYAALSVLNTAIPFILEKIADITGKENIMTCEGYQTAGYREKHSIKKDHCSDAACIAAVCHNLILSDKQNKSFEIRQYRNHNRQIIHHQTERTYKIDGKTIAKNRKKRIGQEEPAFKDWLEEQKQRLSVQELVNLLQKVRVTKSKRSYNNLSRNLPGTIVKYTKPKDKVSKSKTELKDGIYTLKGQRTNGKYYLMFEAKGNFPAKDCKIIGFKSLLYI